MTAPPPRSPALSKEGMKVRHGGGAPYQSPALFLEQCGPIIPETQAAQPFWSWLHGGLEPAFIFQGWGHKSLQTRLLKKEVIALQVTGMGAGSQTPKCQWRWVLLEALGLMASQGFWWLLGTL